MKYMRIAMETRISIKYALISLALFSNIITCGAGELNAEIETINSKNSGDSYKFNWPQKHLKKLEAFDNCVTEDVSYSREKRIEYCTKVHGNNIAEIWKAHPPSTPSPERFRNLIIEFENMANFQSGNRYRPNIPPECSSNHKFKDLLSTRHDLFAFHHSLKKGDSFELFFNRDSHFLVKLFLESYSSEEHLDQIEFVNRKRYQLFIEELLIYYDKVTQTDDWQEKFDTILAGNRWAISKATTYHTANFPVNEDPCYLKSNLFMNNNGWDAGTEGWFYSFWIRRYKEENIELVKLVLEWASSYFSGSEFQEQSNIQKYKIKYMPESTSSPLLIDLPDSPKSQILEQTVSCENLSAPVYPAFVSSYPRDESTIEFKPFISINWEEKAPEKYKLIDTENIHFEDLSTLRSRRNMWGNSEFVFQSPLGCTSEIGVPYLISSSGVNPVEQLNLEGTARFRSNSNSQFLPPIYYGRIVADKKSNSVAGGGFVMLVANQLKNSFTLNTEFDFKANVEGRQVTYVYQKDGKPLELKIRAEHPIEILEKYQFSINDVDLIFVHWVEDNSCDYGCCAFSYSLFKVNKSLESVIWTGYGCDV